MARAPLRYLCLGFLITVAIPAADLAPPDLYEGRPISTVRYEPNLQPVARADLDRLVTFRAGAPLHLAEVRDVIKRLYGTGEYGDIEIEAVPDGASVAVVIRTTEQYFVGAVDVRGKVKMPPSDGQLANASRLDLGTPFEDADVQTAADNMRDLLQRNGLYLAKIEPKVERDAEHQQVSLTFRVDSGKRARLTMPIVIGDAKIPVEQVAKFAKYHGLFKWKLATSENTQKGVQNIRGKYTKQDRLTASVRLDHQEYLAEANRVQPTIKADAGPKIKITTDGAKVSKSKLEKYVPVFDEQTVNRDLLVNGVRNLRDYFQNRGYFDVEVDFSSTDAGNDERDITYTIGLGDRHKVVKVDVKGNRYFTTSQVRERIYTHEAGFVRLRRGRYSDGFARRDEDAITALYRDNGFHDVKVAVKAADDYQGKSGDVAVTIEIEEGPQYTVSALSIQGLDRPNRDAIVERLASQEGQPFSDTNMALDRNHVLEVYQDAGYPDVTFEYKATPGAGPHEMAVQYTIVPGSPRVVRDVLITGLHETRHRLIDRSISLKTGDALSWTEMGRMQRRLYNLGVFDKVDMAIQNPEGDTEHKYVLYNLTEGRRYYAAIGLGAELARIGGNQSSLDSPGGATGFAPRGSFEFSRLNLWGLGHSLNFKSRYSTLDRRVSLNYLAPRYHNIEGRNISVTALYDNTRDVLTFTARRLEGSAQLSQRLSKATTVLWRYTWRDVRVDQNTLKIDPLLIPLVSQPSRIGMISTNLVQDRRDDPTNAHRGIYNSIDLGLVERYFGGNKNFLRFLGRNSYYKRITGDWVLASNTQFGVIKPFHTNGLGDLAYVPIPEHFFSGGGTSHRGFPDNQAGPRDLTTGFSLGGNALLLHSTELRFPFLGDNIDGVIFHDMGNVYSSVSKISFRVHQRDLQDFDYMVHAVGFGVRYRTPVGPVRVDLAYSLNAPTYNGLKGSYQDLILGTATPALQPPRHFNFFISIGQAF